jgi:hypothetical protein
VMSHLRCVWLLNKQLMFRLTIGVIIITFSVALLTSCKKEKHEPEPLSQVPSSSDKRVSHAQWNVNPSDYIPLILPGDTVVFRNASNQLLKFIQQPIEFDTVYNHRTDLTPQVPLNFYHYYERYRIFLNLVTNPSARIEYSLTNALLHEFSESGYDQLYVRYSGISSPSVFMNLPFTTQNDLVFAGSLTANNTILQNVYVQLLSNSDTGLVFKPSRGVVAFKNNSVWYVRE